MHNDQLRLFMERIDRLEEEKKGIGDDIRGVYSEAKSQGYNPTIMRALRKLMKMSPDDRANYEAELETYSRAVGLEGLPLGDFAASVSINGGSVERLDPVHVQAEINTIFGDQDGLYNQAVEIVRVDGKASASYIQRRMRIGYNAAARLIDRMEEAGLVTPPDHVGKRQIIHGRLQ